MLFRPVHLAFRAGGIGLAFLISIPQTASAAPKLRVNAGGAHALLAPQQQEFTWGGLLGIGFELPLASRLALGAHLEGLLLAKGEDPPAPFASPGTGNLFSGRFGFRVTPLSFSTSSTQHSLSVDLSAGYARTGDRARPVVAADLLYDLSSSNTSWGPFVGYRQVFQPEDTLRPEDAHIAVFGLQGSLCFGKDTPEDKDWDRDGILNKVDLCPRVPEDRDGFQDQDGCPDPDNDQDGILDLSDKCPDIAEDNDGFEDDDGCPDLDNDKDTIVDVKDKCPNEPEDFDEFEDDDGCPDLDNDKDGIPDSQDQCPMEPETKNDYADTDGCPDEVSVRVVGDHIVLDEIIYFGWDDSKIRKDSEPLVGRIASLLKDHPEYLSISIEGHTDELGRPEYNLRLSKARAKAVRQKLIEFGVESERLSSVGYGESRPIVPVRGTNQKNRRVEFIIIRKRTRTGTTVPRASSLVPLPEEGSAHSSLRATDGRTR